MNFAQALSIYTKACNAGNGNACSAIGSMYVYGYGIEKNATKSAQFYYRACKLGNKEACYK